ncbi:hypothetical protein KCU62_g8940, partial [Aureobasidium sp. EXF-3399]
MNHQTALSPSGPSTVDDPSWICPNCNQVYCICPSSSRTMSGLPTMASVITPPAVTSERELERERIANTQVQAHVTPPEPTEDTAVQVEETPEQAATTPGQTSTAPVPATPSPAQVVQTSDQAVSTPVQDGTPAPADAETPPRSDVTRSTTPEHTEKTQEEANADVAIRDAVVRQTRAVFDGSRVTSNNATAVLAQASAHLEELRAHLVSCRKDAGEEPDSNPDDNPAVVVVKAKITQQETEVKNLTIDSQVARNTCRAAELAYAHADKHLAKAQHTAAWVRRNMANAYYERLLQADSAPASTHASIHGRLRNDERALNAGSAQAKSRNNSEAHRSGDENGDGDKEESGKRKTPVRRASTFFGSLMPSKKKSVESPSGNQPSPEGENKASPRSTVHDEQGRTKGSMRKLLRSFGKS